MELDLTVLNNRVARLNELVDETATKPIIELELSLIIEAARSLITDLNKKPKKK